MSRVPLVVVVVAFLTLSAGSVPAAAQQSDTVTLTVTVETESGQTVSSATINATWDGGSTEATTAGNGKAFVDVPDGAEVELDATHPNYVRNFPLVVESAEESDVTVEVAPRASLQVDATAGESPLAEASVVLRRDGRIVANGRTDGDGTFASGPIEAGDYSLSVVKAGYFRNTSEVSVSGGTERSVALESGAVSYTVAVVDPHFDPARPVSEASVDIEGVGSVRTLQNGETTVSVPVNSDLAVTVSKDGYVESERTLTIRERAGNTTVEMSRTPSLSVAASNQRVVVGESVTVSVRNAYDEPVEGATVLRNGDSVGETDAEGELAVPVPESGEYELGARADGVESGTVTVTGVDPATETAEPTDTATATQTGTEEPSTGIGPGFSAVVALAALVAFAFALRRR